MGGTKTAPEAESPADAPKTDKAGTAASKAQKNIPTNKISWPSQEWPLQGAFDPTDVFFCSIITGKSQPTIQQMIC